MMICMLSVLRRERLLGMKESDMEGIYTEGENKEKVGWHSWPIWTRTQWYGKA